MSDATTSERRARDDAVMEQVREAEGRSDTGKPLLILTTRSAVTGAAHDKPMCVSEDGADLIVAASAAGQPRHPQWYVNLLVHPEVTVEHGGERYQALASTEPNGPRRDRLFAMMAEQIAGLYGYQDRCRESRQIPIVRLRRTGS